MPELNEAVETEVVETDHLDAEQVAAEQSEEEALRDAQAAKLASELGADESEEDFDPATMEQMTPEQEAAAMAATQEMLSTKEGAEYAATGAIDWFEELCQEHGHEDFKLATKKKENGAKRLTPVVQKYAPQALGLFGQYKDEVMAAIWVGSMAYGSVKQIRALKAKDLADKKAAEPQSDAVQGNQQEAA